MIEETGEDAFYAAAAHCVGAVSGDSDDLQVRLSGDRYLDNGLLSPSDGTLD
jgi:hypothetical protein